jgi:GH18 family chitinase
MASTVPNRQKFIKSLIRYMQKYSLDGVDLGKLQVSSFELGQH